MRLGDFLNIELLPNGKADVNSKGFVSTDYVGMSHGYPNGSYADRAQLAGEHEAYIRGLLTFLATSPRVPVNVRMEMQTWGLCRDEFQSNSGWPPQLYIREARRMVSDYVMTQSHCLGAVRAGDSIGLASYSMDSHSCRRTAQTGVVSNEGDVHQAVPGPYPISYLAIVPRASECENLLVPFCLSASHVAFGSIRMEPVFMITSHSAAVAACVAINDKVSVQQINYQRLRTFLLLEKQIL